MKEKKQIVSIRESDYLVRDGKGKQVTPAQVVQVPIWVPWNISLDKLARLCNFLERKVKMRQAMRAAQQPDQSTDIDKDNKETTEDTELQNGKWEK